MEHWSRIREAGVKGQKNKSMTAYDILSLEYDPSPAGKEQQYRDEMGKATYLSKVGYIVCVSEVSCTTEVTEFDAEESCQVRHFCV